MRSKETKLTLGVASLQALREQINRPKENEISISLLDFEKAFDYIFHRDITEALTRQVFEKSNVKTLTKVCKVTKARIKFSDDIT